MAHPSIAPEASRPDTWGEPAMAARKRSRRPLGSPRHKRRSLGPLLENLENRLVLAQGTPPLLPSGVLAGSGVAPWLSLGTGLQPVPLAHGGTAWMLAPESSGPLRPKPSG